MLSLMLVGEESVWSIVLSCAIALVGCAFFLGVSISWLRGRDGWLDVCLAVIAALVSVSFLLGGTIALASFAFGAATLIAAAGVLYAAGWLLVKVAKVGIAFGEFTK